MKLGCFISSTTSEIGGYIKFKGCLERGGLFLFGGFMNFFTAVDKYKTTKGCIGVRRNWWPLGEHLCGDLYGPSSVEGTSWATHSYIYDGLTSNDWEIFPKPLLKEK